jgi:hypothetical protein
MILGARLGFVLLSQLLAIGFVLYNWVVFFETDKIVAGLFSIVSAVIAIALAGAKWLPGNTLALFQDYAYFILKHIRLFGWKRHAYSDRRTD